MKSCVCGRCGRPIDELWPEIKAFDVQQEYKEVDFCSRECRNAWVKRKKTGMWIALAVGLALALFFSMEMNVGVGLAFFFVPYSIRQLKGILDGSGEFFAFFVVFICSVTVVYPARKFFQEISEYRRIEQEENEMPVWKLREYAVEDSEERRGLKRDIPFVARGLPRETSCPACGQKQLDDRSFCFKCCAPMTPIDHTKDA